MPSREKMLRCFGVFYGDAASSEGGAVMLPALREIQELEEEVPADEEEVPAKRTRRARAGSK